MQIILHNIRSAHNVGSIFRTADAFAVTKLYLNGITPTPRDRFGREFRKITKVALGAEKTVPWTKRTLTIKLLRELKDAGYHIIALEQNVRAVNLAQVQLAAIPLDKLVLILGSETEGLSPGILKLADQIVQINMLGQKESLNVAVAFGIAAYAIRQQYVKQKIKS